MKRVDLLLVNPQPNLEIGKHPNGRPKYTFRGEPTTSITTILSVVNKPALIGWAANESADYVVKTVRDLGLDPVPVGTITEIADYSRGAYARKRDEAAEVGSIAASWIEEHVRARIAGLPGLKIPASEVYPALSVKQHAALAVTLDGFLDWEMSHAVEWLDTEWPMVDEETRIFCREDLFALVDGAPAFLNVKTSEEGYCYPEQILQVTAPAVIAARMGLVRLRARSGRDMAIFPEREMGRMILALPKDGGEPKTWKAGEELGRYFADRAKQKQPVDLSVENCWKTILATKVLRSYMPGR